MLRNKQQGRRARLDNRDDGLLHPGVAGDPVDGTTRRGLQIVRREQKLEKCELRLRIDAGQMHDRCCGGPGPRYLSVRLRAEAAFDALVAASSARRAAFSRSTVS